jgi:hypothetical protein
MTLSDEPDNVMKTTRFSWTGAGVRRFVALWAICGTVAAQAPVYPPSELVDSVSFDLATIRRTAPGNDAVAPESDNWVITWAADDHQYASFGDGRGFGSIDRSRASLGIARIIGGRRDYSAVDVFKTNEEVGPGWTGKSYGLLDIAGTLWLWRSGTGSNDDAFAFSQVYRSTDHGLSWTATNVKFKPRNFGGHHRGAVVPTFLQFGRGYRDSRDGFVYSYFFEDQGDGWEVQVPGLISLARVPVERIDDKDAYEFLSGFEAGRPVWSSRARDRQPVFTDRVNGVMRTSVSYNGGLGKYFLTTQQVSRFREKGAKIGIYEAEEPWGPWFTVLLVDPWSIGLQSPNAAKTVYWNFANKWLSEDGREFVLVYTGPGQDEWGTVEGKFHLRHDEQTR